MLPPRVPRTWPGALCLCAGLPGTLSRRAGPECHWGAASREARDAESAPSLHKLWTGYLWVFLPPQALVNLLQARAGLPAPHLGWRRPGPGFSTATGRGPPHRLPLATAAPARPGRGLSPQHALSCSPPPTSVSLPGPCVRPQGTTGAVQRLFCWTLLEAVPWCTPHPHEYGLSIK